MTETAAKSFQPGSFYACKNPLPSNLEPYPRIPLTILRTGLLASLPEGWHSKSGPARTTGMTETAAKSFRPGCPYACKNPLSSILSRIPAYRSQSCASACFLSCWSRGLLQQ